MARRRRQAPILEQSGQTLQLGTVLAGWYFWKRTGEERLCRVEPELPTVCGGEVYLVKAAACDPKELAETSAGVRKASLDPIVPYSHSIASSPAGAWTCHRLRTVRPENAQCGWWTWGAVELRGKAERRQSQVVLGAGHTRASLGANWAGARPGFPTQHIQAHA